MIGRGPEQGHGDAGELTCVRCLRSRKPPELDRMLWCEDCRETAQARAMDRGWWIGGAVAALLAAYIWLGIEPSRTLLGAWVGITLAAFYLAGRVGKELLYGFERIRNLPAVEAVPPSLEEVDGETDDGDEDGPRRVSFRG